MASHLGEVLTRRGRINEAQLVRARAEQKRAGEALGTALVRLGALSERDLVDCLQAEYGCPVADPTDLVIAADALDLVPPVLARRHQLMPMRLNGNCLTVAMADPSDVSAINELKFVTARDVRVVVASLSSIAQAIQRHYRTELADDIHPSKPAAVNNRSTGADEGDAESAPVVRLVQLLLNRALEQGASDIHFEPFEQLFRIRYRIDGVLCEAMRPPWKLRNAVTARLKVMAGLDIAERRLPQDGRIHLDIADGQGVDLRISVLPTLFGEKVVLRVLDKSAVLLDLPGLGFDGAALEGLRAAAARPHGMILVTGPTGSGKTTTLYATLAELNDIGRNVCTAEDPVEYNLTGINQIQVHEDIGLTFAAALRALLRQDPDVIMVGEIRDRDTAEIAVRAALTGHLVLSTLHTNDAASTVVRLLDMGVEPFLVSSSLRLIVAQRLLRRLCECREPDDATPEVAPLATANEVDLGGACCFRAVGCDRCHGSGYRGRLAVYEVLQVDDAVRAAILAGVSAETLAACAIEHGMRTLRQNALTQVTHGATSLDEALRCTG